MKPRLMIISPVTPYPVSHGAGNAILGYVRALHSEFDIFFTGFCPKAVLDEAHEGLRFWCREVALMAPPEERFLDVFSPTPFYFSNLADGRLSETVRQMYRTARPDLLQVEYFSMAGYADGLDTYRLIRAHVQDWWHFYLGSKQSLKWRARFTQLLGCLDTIAHNRRVLRDFDRVLVTHDEEAKHALELAPKARIGVLPFLLMDCEQFVPSPQLTAAPRILFVGFLPHTPNEEGLGWFLKTVWPRILDGEPGAHLTVVGAGASNAMRGLMHDSGVEYRGYVEDIRTIYAQSRVYIAPIFTGGGIRTKILEAMTAGVPIVSSSFGPLGIGTQAGEHLLAADRPADFAASVLRLCRDEALANSLRVRARRFIEDHYGFQNQAGPLVDAYRQFLREAQA